MITKTFGQISVSLQPRGKEGWEIELADKHLAWKYNIILYIHPRHLANTLRKIADWLEDLV